MRGAGPAALAALGLAAAACADPPEPAALAGRRVVGGDAARGHALVRAYGCQACHAIPGVGPTRGAVGPPLAGFRDRAYIAGRLPNRPDRLVAWLKDPPLFDPETPMPDMGVSDQEAKDIAAYLYTLALEVD